MGPWAPVQGLWPDEMDGHVLEIAGGDASPSTSSPPSGVAGPAVTPSSLAPLLGGLQLRTRALPAALAASPLGDRGG